MKTTITLGSAIAGLALSCATTVSADLITVEIENTQSAGGFAFTPFWLGFHDGSFNTFDAGSSSAGLSGITEIAELGSTAAMMARFGAEQPGGMDTTLIQPDAAPVFSAGESASMTFDLDPSTMGWFNYAAMVVPTNDLFVGNDNALNLFDGDGNFNGPVTIEIYGSSVWDNGSEVNNILDGGAFVDGVDATLGADEGGVVTSFFDDPNASDYITSIIGTTTADGNSITQGFDSNVLLGRITITPAPSAIALFGLVGIGGMRRRRA